MQIDTATVLMSSGIFVSLLALQFLFFWSQDRKSTWLAWWSTPFLLGTAAVALYLQSDLPSGFWSAGLSNAALLAAFAFAWQATRVFEHRPLTPVPVLAAPVLWLVLCSFPDFLASQHARIVAFSALAALFCGLAAWELWRGRDETLPSRRAAIAVLASFGVLIAVRIPLVGVLPYPVGAQPGDPLWMGVLNCLVFLHATFLTVLVISMTKERLEMQQRSFALSDQLTGLLNRRAFAVQAPRIARRQRYLRQPMGLLMLDLDHFKQVNDRYGHDAGDKVLAAFAEIAQNSIRPTDFIFRMGGEEFCCLLPEAGIESAKIVGERIRADWARAGVVVGSHRLTNTCSIGVASSDAYGYEIEVLLDKADKAVYEAKHRGRNRVIALDGADRSLTTNVTPLLSLERRRA